MTEITIQVAGEPRGKGRPRSFRHGNFIGHYTPAETRSYEGMIRYAAQEEMKGRPPIDLPIKIELTAIFIPPTSWSQKKRAEAIAGKIRPAKKPDADNILKAFTDACNGVVYRDDALIVEGRFGKFYGPAAVLIGTVTPISGPLLGGHR